MKLAKKQVLVTEGTAGIGFALARELSLRGAYVTLCARDEPCLDQALAALPGARGLVADVTHESGRQRLRDAVEAQGGLDLLVNNAGMPSREEFERQGAKSIERELYQRAERNCFIGRRSGLVTESFVNLIGPVLLAYALLPALRARSGTLVNVRSGLAYTPNEACAYFASKSALASFSHGLRHSATRSGVHVVEVIPPVVTTEMTSDRGEGEEASAKAVAQAVVERFANDPTRVIPGAARFVPWLARLHLSFS